MIKAKQADNTKSEQRTFYFKNTRHHSQLFIGALLFDDLKNRI